MKITNPVIIIVGLFLLFACSKVMDNNCMTVDTQKYKGEPITIKNEGCVTIEIDSQLSTGYRWRFSIKENPGILVNSDYKVHTAEGHIVGAPDKEIFTFRAVKPGNATITFDYIRPFEKNPKPLKSKEFIITIVE
ncbi:MAG: protease inhibitor I42 family protein [Spirochaetes bacterium]|nr:protease inhibitor I42 family protein [Spirochaetota bacterium]